MASHHLGAVASPRNKWWLHITLARSAPTTHTQLWYAWHTHANATVYLITICIIIICIITIHNSQFSSYIYHKSYESNAVQYSCHIFITNHMSTNQCKQVASILTSCCPLDIHINRNSYIYHKSYECTFFSSHSSVQSCCPLDIHINRPIIYLSQIIWMHITSLASKHKHIFPTGHTIMIISTHSQLGTQSSYIPKKHTTMHTNTHAFNHK